MNVLSPNFLILHETSARYRLRCAGLSSSKSAQHVEVSETFPLSDGRRDDGVQGAVTVLRLPQVLALNGPNAAKS